MYKDQCNQEEEKQNMLKDRKTLKANHQTNKIGYQKKSFSICKTKYFQISKLLEIPNSKFIKYLKHCKVTNPNSMGKSKTMVIYQILADWAANLGYKSEFTA